MNNKTNEVLIKPAKGRPMLTWVGKRPLRNIMAYPAQLIETYGTGNETQEPLSEYWKDWPETYPKCGLLFHGDNKDVLAHLLANGFRGKVKLIYIDPPFDSGADYVRKVTLRGVTGTTKLEGENYTLGEQIQYTDIWVNDTYLQFMYERLLLLKELLSEGGTLFLHCDQRRVHHLRCLLDEVFGPDNFINEIIWQHQIMGGSHDKRFPKAHETILWYFKDDNYFIRSDNPEVRVPFGEYVRSTMKQDESGKWYYERRRMSRKATAEEAASKAHTRTYVDNPDAGTLITDVWSDMLSYQEVPDQRQGLDLYPTQKTVRLLTRLVSGATDPGDIVLDSFAGSGTLGVVAQSMGRRWILADINKGAIQTTAQRIKVLINNQIEKSGSFLPGLIKSSKEPFTTQYTFSVYRINDYDLQIQHNEALNIACEQIGVIRTKTDAFFDGALGKKIVKIAPFTHPLSPLDLEEIKSELKNRPEEGRDIVVVSLGKELAADAWLEDWNRLRRQGDFPNKIDVIELRSDPRYGGFFTHKPAQAKIKVQCTAKGIEVIIESFISPTIIERLKQQAGILTPQIDDWRAMVDSVMIDPAYNGEVFNVVLADVPEKKSDLVVGKYVLPVTKDGTTVAVKITDMLGEEVLITQST